jgi:hypothetical protein
MLPPISSDDPVSGHCAGSRRIASCLLDGRREDRDGDAMAVSMRAQTPLLHGVAGRMNEGDASPLPHSVHTRSVMVSTEHRERERRG